MKPRLNVLAIILILWALNVSAAFAQTRYNTVKIFGGWGARSYYSPYSGITIPGYQASNVSGAGSSISGSAAYSIPGSSAYTTSGKKIDYCTRVYDPRYCGYYYYAPRSNGPDMSGADYYVTGGAVYK